MGLFKWQVNLGDYKYGQCIADGWVRANSIAEAERKVKEIYTNKYETVTIEDNYKFFGDEDMMRAYDACGDDPNSKDVVIRWMD
jgi:hypothetical protein